jgi:hypothetical protein
MLPGAKNMMVFFTELVQDIEHYRYKFSVYRVSNIIKKVHQFSVFKIHMLIE